MFYSIKTTLLIISLQLSTSQSCEIQGMNTGFCDYRYLPKSFDLEAIKEANKNWQHGTDGPCKEGEADHCMPFCGRYIANYYPPCVPNIPKAESIHNRHTTRTKDKWVEVTVNNFISQRIEAERKDEVRKEKNAIHFNKNKDCQEAYKRFFCWMNFPRCDNFEESLPVCQSSCENFFQVCNYKEDLWRCESEIDTTKTFFPGEPFKKNEYLPKSKDEPKIVCTPSIKGSASTTNVWLIALINFAIVLQSMIS